MFLFSAVALIAMFSSFSAKAALIVNNYTSIQHNIRFDDGSVYGVGAGSSVSIPNNSLTGAPITASSTSAIVTWTGIGTLSGAPMEFVYVPLFGMATSVETYPPMSGPYSVTFFPAGGDLIVSFY